MGNQKKSPEERKPTVMVVSLSTCGLPASAPREAGSRVDAGIDARRTRRAWPERPVPAGPVPRRRRRAQRRRGRPKSRSPDAGRGDARARQRGGGDGCNRARRVFGCYREKSRRGGRRGVRGVARVADEDARLRPEKWRGLHPRSRDARKAPREVVWPEAPISHRLRSCWWLGSAPTRKTKKCENDFHPMDFIGKRRSAVSTLNLKPPIKYHDPLGNSHRRAGHGHSSARPGLCPQDVPSHCEGRRGARCCGHGGLHGARRRFGARPAECRPAGRLPPLRRRFRLAPPTHQLARISSRRRRSARERARERPFRTRRARESIARTRRARAATAGARRVTYERLTVRPRMSPWRATLYPAHASVAPPRARGPPRPREFHGALPQEAHGIAGGLRRR